MLTIAISARSAICRRYERLRPGRRSVRTRAPKRMKSARMGPSDCDRTITRYPALRRTCTTSSATRGAPVRLNSWVPTSAMGAASFRRRYLPSRIAREASCKRTLIRTGKKLSRDRIGKRTTFSLISPVCPVSGIECHPITRQGWPGLSRPSTWRSRIWRVGIDMAYLRGSQPRKRGGTWVMFQTSAVGYPDTGPTAPWADAGLGTVGGLR